MLIEQNLTTTADPASGRYLGMQIPDDALDEFIAIYGAEFGEEIDREEASEMAAGVLRLYELFARKLPNGKMTAPEEAT